MLLWALRWEQLCSPSSFSDYKVSAARGPGGAFNRTWSWAPPKAISWWRNPPTEEMVVPNSLTEGFGAGDLLLSGVLVNHSLIRLETPTFSPAVSCKMIKSKSEEFQNGFCCVFHGLDLTAKLSPSLIERSLLSLWLAQGHPVCSEGIGPMNYTVLLPSSFQKCSEIIYMDWQKYLHCTQ